VLGPVATVIRQFNVKHVLYADYIQLYIAFDGRTSLLALDNRFRAVHEWFDYNDLSLHPNKSEALTFGTVASQKTQYSVYFVCLADVEVSMSETVKSFGVTLDSDLTFNRHVDIICKAVSHHIRAQRHSRKYISAHDAML
jgi:hypothetical protein